MKQKVQSRIYHLVAFTSDVGYKIKIIIVIRENFSVILVDIQDFSVLIFKILRFLEFPVLLGTTK
jgi:hypothetical protein